MEGLKPLFDVWLKLEIDYKLRYKARAVWVKFDVQTLVCDVVDERKWFFLFCGSESGVKYA